MYIVSILLLSLYICLYKTYEMQIKYSMFIVLYPPSFLVHMQLFPSVPFSEVSIIMRDQSKEAVAILFFPLFHHYVECCGAHVNSPIQRLAVYVRFVDTE